MKKNLSKEDKTTIITIPQKQDWWEKLIPVIAITTMVATSVLIKIFKEKTSFIEAFIILLFYVMAYIVFIFIYDRYAKGNKEYKNFIIKLEASINKLIQKQRFIDQATLDIIEKEAEDIWVVTTKLASELRNEDLQKSVEDNLKKGKHYTYFLPHPDNRHFEDVNRNLRQFKNLELYKKYKSRVSFIRLPMDTQFLLEEIVIYNPHMEENKDNNTKGLNAFTFYEAKDEEEESVHMKIEGGMIIHIRNRLENYLESTGLKFAAARILSEFSENLEDKGTIYIARLMNRTKIENLAEYNSFIIDLNKSEISKKHVNTIEEILKPHKEQ